MDRDDPILEACLEEVLGGRTAPDLTARILAAMAARDASLAGSVSTIETGRIETAEPVPPPIAALNGHPVVELRSSTETVNKRHAAWQSWLVAASVAGIGLAVGAAGFVLSNRSDFANRPATKPIDHQVAEPTRRIAPANDTQVARDARPEPAPARPPPP